jgi:hypothetical protein
MANPIGGNEQNNYDPSSNKECLRLIELPVIGHDLVNCLHGVLLDTADWRRGLLEFG